VTNTPLTDAERIAEMKSFCFRVVDGLLRVAAAIIFALADRLVQIVLENTVFRSGPRFLELAEQISNVGFVLLDVYLMWDMLTVFVPQLKGKHGIQEVRAVGIEEPTDDL